MFHPTSRTLGAPVEIFAFSELQYNGCWNLFHCKTGSEICEQLDDLTPVLAAVSQAQVLVLGSPVYFTDITGQLKLVIDRFFSFFVPDYPNADQKSRLPGGRHIVLLQTQGESADKHANLLGDFSAIFNGLGFTEHHHLQVAGVRNLGGIKPNSRALQYCAALASKLYGGE